MPPESRSVEKTTSYFTMKTAGLPQSGPVPSLTPQSLHSYRANKSSTPLSSPRLPYSVGQPYPPKMSPSASRVSSTQATSPNYFGLTVEATTDPRDSSVVPLDNWSSPTSSVRPFAAAIPKPLPLDANPEFEAFRKQVDANRGHSVFNLSIPHVGGLDPQLNTAPITAPSGFSRPRLSRWHTHSSDASESSSLPGIPHYPPRTSSRPSVTSAPSNKMDLDVESLNDSAYVSSDSKRNSEASLNPPSFLNNARFESPAQIDSPFIMPDSRRSTLSVPDDRHPRSPVQARADPSVIPALKSRTDPGPLKLDAAPSMMAVSELKNLIETCPSSHLLILDVRVSPQYAQCRIKGALNLCIPTTLLRRATFDLQKLQQTFQGDQDRERFGNWRQATHLVVYDAASRERRDAASAMNLIRKFSNEGYTGSLNILRGGFDAFSSSYPSLVDSAATGAAPGLSLGSNSSGADGSRSLVAPVVGGVLLPKAIGNPNPFFSNIRQNQDLVDGVGQLDIAVPSKLDTVTLPRWLRDAAEETNHGKRVSDKFLDIELTEKSRMMHAYSLSTPSVAGPQSKKHDKVKLSGLEKGGKNRYKDILPFEHARVRLGGRPQGSCDYINASHIKASRSHKRYIASQGPLPATFEDFWSVVWDQDVRVIVMLTAESEGGQVKCHPYWTDREFGPIKLRALSEKKVSLDIDKQRPGQNLGSRVSHSSTAPSSSSNAATPPQNPFTWNVSQAEMGRRRANTTTTLGSGSPSPAPQNSRGQAGGVAGETPYVVIRKFALTHAAHPFAPIREITHLHYPSWPDFGAPAEPSHLLALVELANVMQRSALPVDVPRTLASASASRNGLSGSANQPWGGSNPTTKGGVHDVLHNSLKDGPETDDDARPMLVHCSAGCGRTGAFCTIDSVIDMLKRQRLRSARRDTKMADAEKRNAGEQMNEIAREKRRALGRGADGDVPMDEHSPTHDTAVSPLSAWHEPSSVSPRTSCERSNSDSSITSSSSGSKDTRRSTDDEDSAEGIDTSWIDDDTVDLVARTVEDFRCQRLSMVQSLRQFVLCYEAIMEWLWRLQNRGSAQNLQGRFRSGSLAM